MQALAPTIVRPIFESHPIELVHRRFARGEMTQELALRAPLPTLVLVALAFGAGYLLACSA